MVQLSNSPVLKWWNEKMLNGLKCSAFGVVLNVRHLERSALSRWDLNIGLVEYSNGNSYPIVESSVSKPWSKYQTKNVWNLDIKFCLWTLQKSCCNELCYLIGLPSRTQDDTFIFTTIFITVQFRFVRLLTSLFSSNLEVYFTSAPSWPAGNISTELYLHSMVIIELYLHWMIV